MSIVDAAWRGVPTGSMWICGLSSSGKSTLAALVVRRLRAAHVPVMLLDGDAVRETFAERLGYDASSRRRQTDRVLRLTRMIAGQGVLPVVAIVHPFEDDRARCRAALPGYFEVHLRCSLEECARRDTLAGKHVYAAGATDVVGRDIPFETPAHADVELDSERHSPEALEKELVAALAARDDWRDIAERLVAAPLTIG